MNNNCNSNNIKIRQKKLVNYIKKKLNQKEIETTKIKGGKKLRFLIKEIKNY